MRTRHSSRFVSWSLLLRLGLKLDDAVADVRTYTQDTVKVDASETIEIKKPLTGQTCSNADDPTCASSTDSASSLSNLEECGIWLAPSSIPGAGLGMYAGRDFEPGEPLQQSGEVVVGEIDINQHQFELGDKFMLLWDEYTWSGGGLHMDHEAYVENKVQSPGFGSAANSFIDLINVEERRPFHSIPNGLHRHKDPGVGAFSPYHNRESIASVPIKRGEELYVDYGQQWFRDRPHLGSIPLLGDLERATQMFRRFFELQVKFPRMPGEVWGELWVQFVEATEWEESRVLGAFRKTDSEWEALHNNMTLKEIRIEEGLRTDEWLQEHGTCADNMQEGESTIRQAGRGAFATRRLIKDTVIAPLPLIHISDSSILEMLEFDDIKTLKTNKVRNGIQLTLNYCFGHQQSTLLLCPYGPLTSLINHNQTQANVRLQWAAAAKGNHEPSLLRRPIEHFATDKTAKLAMELVATRDIMPGEEIFLDYGSEWEAAWQEHVRNWKPLDSAIHYISAHQLNTSPLRLRTEFEQMQQPYPGNVDLQCDPKFFQTIDYEHFQKTGEVKVTDYFARTWAKCELLRFRRVGSGNDGLRYTAIALMDENRNEKLSDAPREAFRFVDRPYSSDMFLPNAFRHAMMIPDHMFPEYWMNI